MKRLAWLLLAAATPVAAQRPDLAGRLAGRVPAAVIPVVQSLSDSAVAHGLPVEPLFQKAIEGGAKGVPAERISAALQTVFVQLDGAAKAIRSGGASADVESITAGAFSLAAGLDSGQVRDLVRASLRANATAVTLRVSGMLTALGVPGAKVVALVSATLQAGGQPGDVLALPGRVQDGIAHGERPEQAAEGLARAAAARVDGGLGHGRGRTNPHRP